MNSWTCPYCNQPTTLTDPNIDSYWNYIKISKDRIYDKKWRGLRYNAVACPNTECGRLTVLLEMTDVESDIYQNKTEGGTVLQQWQLLPESSAKPQPEYIPNQIVEDYTEACRIKDLSPKASSALSRRCLQGIIRDYWKVKKNSLKDEIDELEDKLTTPEWEAIDAVRSVGNIGAHMEKDVNVIIKVEPEEADLLISLIEDLFDTWYVARHDREEKQRKLKALAESKKAAKKQPKKGPT